MDNKTIVENWIAENQASIHVWKTNALQQFWDDTSVRMPRTVLERANGLEIWLKRFRLKMGLAFEEEFRHQFVSLSALLPESYVADVFNQNVWPQIKPEVQQYAMYGFAAAWVGRHLGDATTLGTPKCDGQQWIVSLGVKGYGDSLGQIALNLDGEVIPELTTTRRNLLEAIREPSLPTFTAASR